MPPSATPGAKPPAKVPAKKGGMGGIPKWGWIAGGAIGLVIGYMIVKKSGSSTTPDATAGNDTGSSANPLGTSNSGSGGGVVASPPPDYSQLMAELQAMGLTPAAGASSPPGTTSDQTQELQPTPSGFSSAPNSPSNSTVSSTSNQDVAQRVQQGYAVAPPPGSNIHVPGAQM